MVTGTLPIFYLHVYALLDPGASLSLVTPYIAVNFQVRLEILLELFLVPPPVGRSILARRVYRNGSITVF